MASGKVRRAYVDCAGVGSFAKVAKGASGAKVAKALFTRNFLRCIAFSILRH